MSGHWVTITLGARYESGEILDVGVAFECEEPEEADCRYTSDCDCESWHVQRDKKGVFHLGGWYDEPNRPRHDMHLDPDGCGVKPWWDGGGEESFRELLYEDLRPGRHELKLTWDIDYCEFDYLEERK